jgi:hypothetical protein
MKIEDQTKDSEAIAMEAVAEVDLVVAAEAAVKNAAFKKEKAADSAPIQSYC